MAFETLQTEYWIAGYDAIKSECAKRGFKIAEAVADNDANRQLEQVKNFITRKVDGIILVPKDASTCIPMIKAANAAFGGRSALDVMAGGELTDLMRVRRYLDAERGGW